MIIKFKDSDKDIFVVSDVLSIVVFASEDAPCAVLKELAQGTIQISVSGDKDFPLVCKEEKVKNTQAILTV